MRILARRALAVGGGPQRGLLLATVVTGATVPFWADWDFALSFCKSLPFILTVPVICASSRPRAAIVFAIHAVYVSVLLFSARTSGDFLGALESRLLDFPISVIYSLFPRHLSVLAQFAIVSLIGGAVWSGVGYAYQRAQRSYRGLGSLVGCAAPFPNMIAAVHAMSDETAGDHNAITGAAGRASERRTLSLRGLLVIMGVGGVVFAAIHYCTPPAQRYLMQSGAFHVGFLAILATVRTPFYAGVLSVTWHSICVFAFIAWARTFVDTEQRFASAMVVYWVDFPIAPFLWEIVEGSNVGMWFGCVFLVLGGVLWWHVAIVIKYACKPDW